MGDESRGQGIRSRNPGGIPTPLATRCSIVSSVASVLSEHDELRRIWKLIPVKLDLGSRPTWKGLAPAPAPAADRTLSRHTTDASIAHILTNYEFGTTAVEATVITATNPVTTRKKHRVEGD